MIAVIADDLTGAAELAGIALDLQLRTEIDTVVDPACKADLLIIATDTRSLPSAEAKKIITKLTQQLLQLKPQLIFKKIDSVLRGNVIDEITSQLQVSGIERALIVPGNPSHGKQVINGVYYYNKQPVHLSSYADDPGFPVRSSDVKQMLRANNTVTLIKHTDAIPEKGIAIGEVAEEADFDHWVKKWDSDTLLAGAAGLFHSLLKYLKPISTGDSVSDKAFNTPRLFVFGSTFKKNGHRIVNGSLHNVPILYIPAEILCDRASAQQILAYCQQVANTLKQRGAGIMAIHPNDAQNPAINPYALTKNMGLMVNRIRQQTPISELLI